ncbi:MAG: gamma-glutamyltransferase [Rugosibacter sp.]|nr:gamma-glutamyltransferase [Rugosibacter sp.]
MIFIVLRKISRLLAGLSLIAASCQTFGASQFPVAAENGMVVTAHHLATQVGVNVLKKGGNAIDAAVAVGYTLAVVYPAAGNLGGGGFMTIQLADDHKTFLDFRETAPLAATATMYLDENGNVIKNLSTRGYLAAGVPGTVAGLELARTRYGTMSRHQLIAPAVKLAKKGFVLSEGDVDMLSRATDIFRQDAPSTAIFLRHGQAFTAGERLVQKDLARSLNLISREGPSAFYNGSISRAIVAASQRDGGILSPADFARYQARELAPIECDYRGYRILSAPPPSSGGVVLCEMLNILEGYPLKELGYLSAQAVHYQIEAMRHAYADRNNYLGDPGFVNNPLQQLLDKRYAANIRAAINPSKAGISLEIKPGSSPHDIPREGTNTTHYSIVDKAGNAVSVTYTLNTWFGAGVTVPGTGILLNNEMDDFTIKAGVPNVFGLVQGPANTIAPGKRPLSSMSPTIVSREGKPVMVIGTPGGSRIITVVLHTILNVIDYGMNIQEAIDAPRFHHQWLPDVTEIETFALSPDTRKLLIGMGHTLDKPQPANHAAGILIGAPALDGKPRGNNRFYGAIDPRRNTGLAAGY